MTNDVPDHPLAPHPRSAGSKGDVVEGDGAIDIAFLDAQTFGDAQLRREVLGLFVAQLRRVIPSLPASSPREQADMAHLLKGSARGIGAWAAADSAGAYEAAPPERRAVLLPVLERAFARVEAAIVAGASIGERSDEDARGSA